MISPVAIKLELGSGKLTIFQTKRFCKTLNTFNNVLVRLLIGDRNKKTSKVDSSWNVMAHGDVREGKWRGNWRMEWVASTLHTTSEHGVSSITTADAHTSAASSRLNWRPPARFKWTRTFRRKTKYGFCARAVTFQLASNKGKSWGVPSGNSNTNNVCGICKRYTTPTYVISKNCVKLIAFSNANFVN